MKIYWKLLFVVLTACALSVVAILPYAFTLAAVTLDQITLPLPVLGLVSILQSSVLFAIVISLGLKLARVTGLGLPIMEAVLSGGKIPSEKHRTLGSSVIWGVAVGITIVLLDRTFTFWGVPIGLGTSASPPIWMGFLASFYGGIAEEVLLRLFVMNLLVWILGKMFRLKNPVSGYPRVLWFSITFAALLFGAGHLPITSTMTQLTPLVIVRALVLNGVGGVLFGWLFWKNGLESAVVAHFCTDIILHTLYPAVMLLGEF